MLRFALMHIRFFVHAGGESGIRFFAHAGGESRIRFLLMQIVKAGSIFLLDGKGKTSCGRLDTAKRDCSV